MSINERIRDLRKDRGLNQTDFAARLRLKQSAISSIEKGINTVTDQNIRLICDTFHVREAWLRDGEEPRDAPAAQRDPLEKWAAELVEAGAPHDFAYRFASALAELTDPQWHVLETIFDKMLEKNAAAEAAPAAKKQRELTIEEKAALYDAQQEAKETAASSSFPTTAPAATGTD